MSEIEIRPAHVVDVDAGPKSGRSPVTWGYGEDELQRVMMTSARVDGTAEARATAALMCSAWVSNGVLPEPLDLVIAACGLGSRQVPDIDGALGRARAAAGAPVRLHRRVLASTYLGEPGQPCTAWGIGYLAALGGVPRERARVIARRRMLEMSRPVAVVQMALHLRGLVRVEDGVRAMLGAAPVRMSKVWRLRE